MAALEPLTERQVRTKLIELVEEHDSLSELVGLARTGDGVQTNIGRITVVEQGTAMNKHNDKIEYIIIQIGTQMFRIDGWYDSWSGMGEMAYADAYEVVQRPVTRYEYLRK